MRYSRTWLTLFALVVVAGLAFVSCGREADRDRGPAFVAGEKTSGSNIVGAKDVASATPALAASPAGSKPAASSQGAKSNGPEGTLVIGIAAQVRGFTSLNALQNKYIEDIVSGSMMIQGSDGQWRPELFEEIPSQEKGTWVLNKDGTSETIYKIRENLKWHDGYPFTVDDMKFWWEVCNDKDIPWEKTTECKRMAKMEQIDDYTLRVTWNSWYPLANIVENRTISPLPRHILGDVYKTDKERFMKHPWFTSSYVGLGPYKVVELVPGDHMTLEAFQDYPLPMKIKNIVIRFLPSRDVLVSELFAGKIDMTLHGSFVEGALDLANAITIADQWQGTDKGRILLYWNRMVQLAFQNNPEFQYPPLGDVRIRQALFHAVDRESIVKEQFRGLTEPVNAWVPTKYPDYKDYAPTMTAYPYDPEKAKSLFAEAGWTKGADGMLRNAEGKTFDLEFRATPGNEDASIRIADQWKSAGVNVNLVMIPEARMKDNEWLAKYSGVMTHYRLSTIEGGSYGRFRCENVPNAKNRWVGVAQNPAGYCSEEFQQLVKDMEKSFPEDAWKAKYIEMQAVAQRDLPYLDLWFTPEPVPVSSRVQGVEGIPPFYLGRLGMLSREWYLADH